MKSLDEISEAAITAFNKLIRGDVVSCPKGNVFKMDFVNDRWVLYHESRTNESIKYIIDMKISEFIRVFGEMDE